MPHSMAIDYSLYFVADSTTATLKHRNLAEIAQAAIEGGMRLTYQNHLRSSKANILMGATIVQFRDKTSETRKLIQVAKQLHAVTKQHNVPLLINDRVDVALAISAEGVHIGQDDIDLDDARRLLGEHAIIGVSVSSIEEARQAIEGGADYLGIGTIFATQTKDAKSIIGVAGAKEILESLDRRIPTVAIGGINASNVQQVLYESKTSSTTLDGVAVVSAIIGADDPKAAACELQSLIQGTSAYTGSNPKGKKLSHDDFLQAVPDLVKKLVQVKPLCHNIMNGVVQNFAANVALAIGASPIMTSHGGEAEDLSKLAPVALVINIGTMNPDGIRDCLQAVRAYNTQGNPVLFDPVGAGATEFRRNTVKALMTGGHFDVIKGNEREIMTLWGEDGAKQRGVDSDGNNLSDTEKARLVKMLAAREGAVIVMTGPTDYVSDPEKTYAISNGHEYLGRITGSGCTLGTTIAAFLAVHPEDYLLATITGLLMFEIAAEHAALREDVKGPGTFLVAFIDELSIVAKQTATGDITWLKASKIQKLEV